MADDRGSPRCRYDAVEVDADPPDSASVDPKTLINVATSKCLSHVMHSDDQYPETSEAHNPTPHLLPRYRFDAWLHPTLMDPDKVYEVLAAIELEPLEVRRISPAVNSLRNSGADLLKPVADDADRPLELALVT